jgi:hypothetical protein
VSATELPIADENEGADEDHEATGDLMELFEVTKWNEAVEDAHAEG